MSECVFSFPFRIKRSHICTQQVHFNVSAIVKCLVITYFDLEIGTVNNTSERVLLADYGIYSTRGSTI